MSTERNMTIQKVGILLLLTLSLVLAGPVVSAQSPGKLIGQNFEFGFRGGVSWADMVGPDGTYAWDSRRTWTAGAFVAFPISSRFAVQTDLTFKRYGESFWFIETTEDQPDGSAEYEFVYRLDYIAVTPMMRFQPVSQGPVTPILAAGPRLDICINAERGREDYPWDIYNENRLTFGVDFGVMLVFDFEPRIFIDFRGSIGLTNVFGDPQRFLGGDERFPMDDYLDVKNNMVAITAGFLVM